MLRINSSCKWCDLLLFWSSLDFFLSDVWQGQTKASIALFSTLYLRAIEPISLGDFSHTEQQTTPMKVFQCETSLLMRIQVLFFFFHYNSRKRQNYLTNVQNNSCWRIQQQGFPIAKKNKKKLIPDKKTWHPSSVHSGLHTRWVQQDLTLTFKQIRETLRGFDMLTAWMKACSE